MSDLILQNTIYFQTQKRLKTLKNFRVLLNGISIDLRARNFVHAKTSLRARCVYARHRARNLSSPERGQSYQSFLYENHYECYKRFASRSSLVLFTLTYFFLIHTLSSSAGK